LGKFNHEIPNQNQREKFAQYSTPPHITKFMHGLLNDFGKSEVKDQIIYEPFVGAGAMFLPLRNKGAVLVGSDIDLDALEICKQLVPEAILIHHNSIGCLEPKQNIQYYQNKIKEISEKSKSNKKQAEKDNQKITQLEQLIEKEKQRTPWRWGLYCVEHLYHEPKETFLNLTRILRDREIKQMREKYNQGKEMYFDCFACSQKVVDYQICENKQEQIICQNCYSSSK